MRQNQSKIICHPIIYEERGNDRIATRYTYLIYAKTADSPKQGNFGFDMVKT